MALRRSHFIASIRAGVVCVCVCVGVTIGYQTKHLTQARVNHSACRGAPLNVAHDSFSYDLIVVRPFGVMLVTVIVTQTTALTF